MQKKKKKLSAYEVSLSNISSAVACVYIDHITFSFPWVTQTANELLRTNPFVRKRYRRLMSLNISFALSQAMHKPEPYQCAHVDIIRRIASKSGPDHDGLIGGVKDFVDCLTTPSLTKPNKDGVRRVRNPNGMGLIVDDSPQHMQLTVRHEYSRENKGLFVTIRKVLPNV